jgi:fermentation-respiration switch protein FrsA (DUF1100 family)
MVLWVMVWAARAVIAVVVVVALMVALAWVFQRRLIYIPDRSPVPPAAAVLPGARDVVLTTADGLRLGAWLVPPSGPARGVSVLVAGGNGGNREYRAPLARALSAAGMTVLLMDYRGYGGNPGAPTEEGLTLDAEAAYDHLARAGEPIIYFGESLGAGVVTGLALRRPPAGMVLRSPFTDLAAAGQLAYPFLPVRPLLWDRFPVAERVAAMPAVPTTVVYGARDTIVPPQLSRAVAAAAPSLVESIEIKDAGHNDLTMLDGPEVIGAVRTMADRVASGDQAS